jgi:hypothetical protein
MAPTNANESYCTFTLPTDVTAGGLVRNSDIFVDGTGSMAWMGVAYRLGGNASKVPPFVT